MIVRIYPEYYDGDLQKKDIEIFGRWHGRYSRMFLHRDGKEIFYYDKFNSDGFNEASVERNDPQIYEINNVAIGIVCCMDVGFNSIVDPVIEKLNISKCKHKIIAVSANMTHKYWFSNDEVSSPLNKGIYLALSNGCPDGTKSFITNTSGKKLPDTYLTLDNVRIELCGLSK